MDIKDDQLDKGHVRGALNNGVTPAGLQELVLHATIYCGIPAAAEVVHVGRVPG